MKKLAEKPTVTMLVGGPITNVNTETVQNVDIAKMAELKSIVRGFLLISRVVQTPSRADIT
ncbi:MAG TPA: hypothetical protein VJM12_08415, partial [Pyrinomonadaceae bacterium]|nr:hypothetical protein [Pyrinomonadaceae bacterium]